MEAPDRRKFVADCSDSRCYRPGHGKTNCGTEASFKARHGKAARERPNLQDYRPIRYGRGFGLVEREPCPKLLHTADTRSRAGFLPNQVAPARATWRDFSRVAGTLGLLRLMICAANSFLNRGAAGDARQYDLGFNNLRERWTEFRLIFPFSPQ